MNNNFLQLVFGTLQLRNTSEALWIHARQERKTNLILLAVCTKLNETEFLY
jgi:hypothetical protein